MSNTTISDSSGNEHFCQQCNLRIHGNLSWRQHLESRGHRRREKFEDLFALNPDDIFMDENAPTEKLLSSVYGLIGLEDIIEDRTNSDVKCMLCRALLKDKTTIVDHVRTNKHQLNYLEKIAPEVTRSMQKNSLTKSDLNKFVQTSCEEFIKKYGRKKIRVYEKGYGERRRQKLAELRANSINEADDILAISSKCFPSNIANIDEFDEMPKNALVMQTLLNSTIVEFQTGETSHINDVMRDMPGPILGLEYIAEYADSNGDFEQGYFCTLCEAVMNSGQLINHVTKKDHKLTFLARDHSNYHNIICFPGFTQERRDELLKKYGSEVEENKGRIYISSRIILPPNCEFLFRYHKRLKPVIASIDRSVKVLGTAAASFMGFDDSDSGGSTVQPASTSANSLLQQQRLQRAVQDDEKRRLQVRLADEHNRLQVEQLQRRAAASELQTQLAQTLASALLTNMQSLVPNHHQPQLHVSPPQPHHGSRFGPQQFTVPPPTLLQVQPPVFHTIVEDLVTPRKPNFVYSEREAQERLQHRSGGDSAAISSIPLFAVKNLKNQWYSDRSISLDYHAQRFPSADYVSLRFPGARQAPYGDWSPYLMRRLQDQFNFELDHLAWLQDQFLHWRTPQYQPLEMVDLRPLDDEVEVAVLEVFVGQTLKPSRSTKDRKMFDYPITSGEEETPEKRKRLEKDSEIFDYQHSGSAENKICISVEKSASLEEKPSPKESLFRKRKATKSEILPDGNVILNDERFNGDKKEKTSPPATSTPPKPSTPNDAHQKAILELSQKILKIAQQANVDNAVVKLLLSYGDAEKILYNLATKDQKTLNEVVAVIKNPGSSSLSALSEWKAKFDAFSDSG